MVSKSVIYYAISTNLLEQCSWSLQKLTLKDYTTYE